MSSAQIAFSGSISSGKSTSPNKSGEPLLASEWQFGDYAGGSSFGGAWERLTGWGVQVGVVDSGLDANHAQLKKSLEQVVSSGPSGSVFHATAVAGIIAAAADGVGTVGGAPDARLHVFDVGFGQANTNASLAAALRASAGLDVVNNSWSFQNNFETAAATPVLGEIADAVRALGLSGRGGLGTSVVFAAGNGREGGQTTAAHLLQSLPEVITVGAVRWDGKPAAFSAPGSSVLVSAGGEAVPTLDASGAAGYLPGDYATLSGTSFAAPVITSIVALMLEAEPNLGARDIQEILVLSARQTAQDAATNGAKSWNGGGLAFSEVTGFGVVNASVAARLADTWLLGRAPATFATAKWAETSSPGGLGFRSDEAAAGTLRVTSDLVLDRAQLTVGLDPSLWNSVTIQLVSPSGSVATLLRPGQAPTGGPADGVWTFMANQFWGEKATGNWTVQVQGAGVAGQVKSLSLSLLGDELSGPQRHVLTDAYLALAASEPARQQIKVGAGDTLSFAAVSKPVTVDLAATDQLFGGQRLRLEGGENLGVVVGGSGPDIIRAGRSAVTLAGGDGDDVLIGGPGDDILLPGWGNDGLNGGGGYDAAVLEGTSLSYKAGLWRDALVLSAEGTTVSLRDVEELRFADGVRLAIADFVQRADVRAAFQISSAGQSHLQFAERYSGPVDFLEWRLESRSGSVVVEGTAGNDFIKLVGGFNAVSGGGGRDVIDAGPGSNFMLGGQSGTVFFLDGRGGQKAWNTIVGWKQGDQAAVWGWTPGVSKMTWQDGVGADGYQGSTVHCDLDGDGAIDVSLTFAGLSQSSVQQPQQMDGVLFFG